MRVSLNRRLSLCLLTMIGGVCIYSLVHVNQLEASSQSSEVSYSETAQADEDDKEIEQLKSLIARMKEINQPPPGLTGNTVEDSAEPPNSTFYADNSYPYQSNVERDSHQLSYNPSDAETEVYHPHVHTPDYYEYGDIQSFCSDEVLCDIWKLRLNSFWVSHLTGPGVGYRSGYSTIGAISSLNNPIYSDIKPFLDVRAHYFNSGKWAANVGLGARWYNECWEKTIGLNVYYDYRRGDTLACLPTRDFNQIGFGAELFGCLYDLRLNVYIPLGARSESSCPQYYFYPGDYFAAHRHKRKALPGFDAEIETRLRNWDPCSCLDLYGAIGPYYFASFCGKDCAGGRIRIGLDFWDFFTIEAWGSYDSMFGAICQGLVRLSIPFDYDKTVFGCGCKRFTLNSIKRVQRQELIVLSRKHCVWDTNF